MRYKPPTIEDEGINVYLNRTAFDHGGVDFDMFKGFVERGMNKTNLMRAMDVKAVDTINRWLKIYDKWKQKEAKRQIEDEKRLKELGNS